MANPDHQNMLRQGVDAWNAWREREPSITPNLSGANLSDADLSEANLVEANLVGAKLSEAVLRDANLHKAAPTGSSSRRPPRPAETAARAAGPSPLARSGRRRAPFADAPRARPRSGAGTRRARRRARRRRQCAPRPTPRRSKRRAASATHEVKNWRWRSSLAQNAPGRV